MAQNLDSRTLAGRYEQTVLTATLLQGADEGIQEALPPQTGFERAGLSTGEPTITGARWAIGAPPGPRLSARNDLTDDFRRCEEAEQAAAGSADAEPTLPLSLRPRVRLIEPDPAIVAAHSVSMKTYLQAADDAG